MESRSEFTEGYTVSDADRAGRLQCHGDCLCVLPAGLAAWCQARAVLGQGGNAEARAVTKPNALFLGNAQLSESTKGCSAQTCPNPCLPGR